MKNSVLLVNKSIFIVIYCLISLFTSVAFAQTIVLKNLPSPPVIDGSGSDWTQIPATKVQLQNNKSNGKANITSVDVKAGVNGDSVYFMLQWEDDDMDAQHKPYVWDEAKGKYIAGKQREDRLAIQFGMTGEYDVNWFSGKLFSADTWHWKAARTNDLGIAQDKMTVISDKKSKKTYKAKASNGSIIYIKRSSDKGTKLYLTKRYATKDKDIMPKYIMASSVSGSIADVKAKGVWENGKWTLELSRKLDTGNSDDAVFNKGQNTVGGIAIFDHSGNEDHSHSNKINFQF